MVCMIVIINLLKQYVFVDTNGITNTAGQDDIIVANDDTTSNDSENSTAFIPTWSPSSNYYSIEYE